MQRMESADATTGNSNTFSADKTSTAKSERTLQRRSTTMSKATTSNVASAGRVRLLLLVVVVVVGVLLSTVAYLCIQLGDEDDTTNNESVTSTQQSDFANRVFYSLRAKLDAKLAEMEFYSVEITSSALRSQSTWPEVMIDDFEWIGSKLREITATQSVFFLPLVKADQRQGWESYSDVFSQIWMADSFAFLAQSPTPSPKADVVTPIRPIIWDYNGNASDDGPFLPLWQSSPISSNPSIYNFNMLKQPQLKAALQTALQIGSGVIGSIFLQQQDLAGDVLQPLIHSGSAGPLSPLIYPVFKSQTQKPSAVAGFIVALMPWDTLFADVTPTSVTGDEICVIEDSMGQVHSYLLGGTGLEYLGPIDQHDPQWDDLMQSRELRDLMNGSMAVDSLNYTIKVYPSLSSPTEPTTTSNNDDSTAAIMYTTLAACAFLVIVLLFSMHLYLVNIRQVKASGAGSTATVQMGSADSSPVQSEKALVEEGVEAARPAPRLPKPPLPVEYPMLCSKQVEDPLLRSKQLGDPLLCTEQMQDPLLCSKELKPFEDNRSVGSDDTSSQSQMRRPSLRHGGPSQFFRVPAAKRLNSVLKEMDDSRHTDDGDEQSMTDRVPVADFFPKCTVVFGDIVGFAAWSSQHEPTQVFTLLQSLYQAFDLEARKQGVVKVDSTGDSYVAVTGLPDPQEDHAVRMAVFALACRKRMREVTRRLERTLGPEVADLGMRFGLHSGPVTAGVLHCDRSRFQIFGDTVNVAACVHNFGHKNLILVSEATSLLLMEAERGSWVCKRDEPVFVPGKGDMHTYWLDDTGITQKGEKAGGGIIRRSTLSLMSTMFSSSVSVTADDMYDREDKDMKPRRLLRKAGPRVWGKSEVHVEVDENPTTKRKKTRRSHAADMTKRLIDWNVDMLLGLLKQVVVKRALGQGESDVETFDGHDLALRDKLEQGGSVVDEVAEIIPMPAFDPMIALEQPIDVSFVDVDEKVEAQLRAYVTSIASMYRDNPFHNYEHACHVQLAMLKLLQRVVSPCDINYEGESSAVASDAHKYTYGITSDPLTQFAVVFCALIHDIDHTGVPNGQLVKEKAHIATVYQNKSVAEQNSIDLAWDFLMGDEFQALRNCIYTNVDEFKRFRQLVVNVVLATDIFDKELSTLRKNRWTKAFTEKSKQESELDYINRKATIVIEHLIQASDVSHTMQHWDIYRKWNERLFHEMLLSYQSGRSDSNPAVGWYKGELWFFDNYVIPLAKKLKECDVFGVSSDECLNYAMENRNMWKTMGEQIVAEMSSTDYFARSSLRNSARS